jgi:NAD(P)-dependent dehydrogenase (short-subunit alcohol dehydrogenase family)
MRLEGKVALVTGGNRGIGAACVRLFAQEGARVVFCARRAALGDAVADEVRASGGDVAFVACDVTDEDAVEALVAGTVERYGRLDIVVNAAGIAPASPVESMELAVWTELLAINVTSMFLVCKHAIPRLRAAGPGSAIVNLGSTFGAVGAPGSAGYALTKAAHMNFTKSLALELASDGIRVNAVCPGGTDTEFLHEWFEATGDAAGTEAWLVSAHPLGRLGRPEEMAKAALYLASDDASFVTGHSLLVDGGYTAQ